MTRTELYDLASTVGEKPTTETDGAKLDLAVASAAEQNNIDPADYQTFKADALGAKHNYFVLGQQKLQSEINADNAAKKLTALKPAA